MWNGFECETFEFKSRIGTIVKPSSKPNGRILLKTEYLDAFPDFDIAMLKRGYHLIHITHFSRWAPDEEIHIMAEYVKYCVDKLGFNKACILEGLSCGGAQAVRFASIYPELVSVLYLDAPVMNILSMAGLGTCNLVPVHWEEIQKTFDVNKSTIVNFRKSPIDNMEPLIENKIPVIMLYGDADEVVIYEENGKNLEDFYNEQL